MANQRSGLNMMVPSVPKIQIIPPTPDVGKNGEECATETPKVMVWQPDIEEFKDPDCEVCEEETHERPAEVIMEVDGQVPGRLSEREVNENEEDIFRDEGVENCLERSMRVLATFNDSKYMLILQFLLLVIPISAGFMGAKYLDKCPLSSETPVFLFMMGIAGTIVIICRILLISQKILLPTHREWEVLRVVVIVGNLAIIVCLATAFFSRNVFILPDCSKLRDRISTLLPRNLLQIHLLDELDLSHLYNLFIASAVA